jgi:transcriptional regulator with XRE-family HTH domain
MSHKLSLVPVPENPVQHQSLLAQTFEAEIKRTAAEAKCSIAEVMRELANVSGISENHLYNYRSGKTDIPGQTIRAFCTIFKSNALADVVRCDELEFDIDGELDLTQLCSRHVRSMLEAGNDFLDAFADGKIDGHEELKLVHTTARIHRDSFRLLEVAQQIRRRGLHHHNPPPPAAA